MTRRSFFAAAVSMGVPTSPPVTVPVHIAIDTRAKISPSQLQRFWPRLWNQAVGDFARGGIRIDATCGESTVDRPVGREPVILGLARGALNVIVTNQIPIQWDRARALCGVTTLYRGYHVSMIALR